MMIRSLLPLAFVLFSNTSSYANDESSVESLRAGVMYMIQHESEITLNNGHFGLFTPTAGGKVKVAFYEQIKAGQVYTDTLSLKEEGQRPIESSLFAYDRNMFDLDMIKKELPQLFSIDEPLCQNAFFPFTVCLSTDKP